MIFVGLVSASQSAWCAQTADWMNELYETRSGVRLNEIVIPGTHNSGTYQISPYSEVGPGSNVLYHVVRPLVASWAKTQYRSFREQLTLGIRFFDLRVAFDSSGQALITHGLVSMGLQPALNEISSFILQHPKEVILIAYELSFDYQANRLTPDQRVKKKQEVQQLLNDHFGEAMISFSSQRRFSDFWGAGKSVMLLEEYQNFWPNQDRVEAVKAYLDQSLQSQNLDLFRNVQLILTPSSNLSTFLDFRYAFPFYPGQNSLSLFSQSLRDQMLSWIRGWHDSGSRLNIVTADFFDQCPLISTLLDMNGSI